MIEHLRQVLADGARAVAEVGRRHRSPQPPDQPRSGGPVHVLQRAIPVLDVAGGRIHQCHADRNVFQQQAQAPITGIDRLHLAKRRRVHAPMQPQQQPPQQHQSRQQHRRTAQQHRGDATQDVCPAVGFHQRPRRPFHRQCKGEAAIVVARTGGIAEQHPVAINARAVACRCRLVGAQQAQAATIKQRQVALAVAGQQGLQAGNRFIGDECGERPPSFAGLEHRHQRRFATDGVAPEGSPRLIAAGDTFQQRHLIDA
ncbi:hypothetical protein G6F35_011316 [Rhizopus arrhizus]|nr:hypothetical protein G6F35_011316 [Rhizopus arrhizus]